MTLTTKNNLTDDIAEITHTLNQIGYVHLQHNTRNILRYFIRNSICLQYAKVSPHRKYKGLSNSAKALDLHTDHHLAEYIILHAVEPAQNGGKNLLADMQTTFDALPQDCQQILERISFQEHKIFPSDIGTHPFITRQNNEPPKFYYTFWLANNLTETQNLALEIFKNELTKRVKFFMLNKGDLLIIDNHRIAHGRTAIQGNRMFERYWLQDCNFLTHNILKG